MGTSIPQNPTNVSLNQAASTAPITQEPQEQAKPTLVSVPPAPSPSTQKTEEALANRKPQTINTEKFKKLDALTSKFVTAQEAGTAGPVPGQTAREFFSAALANKRGKFFQLGILALTIAVAITLTVISFGAAAAPGATAAAALYALMTGSGAGFSILCFAIKCKELSKEVEAEHVARHKKISEKSFTEDVHFEQLQKQMAAFAKKIDETTKPDELVKMGESIRYFMDAELISLRKLLGKKEGEDAELVKYINLLESDLKHLENDLEYMRSQEENIDSSNLETLHRNLKNYLHNTMGITHLEYEDSLDFLNIAKKLDDMRTSLGVEE